MFNARATNECSCDKWGEWAPCSESCGNGHMKRVCIGKDNCVETKSCKERSINCEGAHTTQLHLSLHIKHKF